MSVSVSYFAVLPQPWILQVAGVSRPPTCLRTHFVLKLNSKQSETAFFLRSDLVVPVGQATPPRAGCCCENFVVFVLLFSAPPQQLQSDFWPGEETLPGGKRLFRHVLLVKGNLLVRGEWGELKRSSWCLLASIGGGSEKNCFIGREGWGNESADSWTATTAPMIFFCSFALCR